MKNMVAWGAVGAASLVAPQAAFAHALMTSPRPRDQSDAHKDPTGPCGVTRTAAQPTTVPPLAAGSTTTITWNETVNHPGCFVVDFSAANDLNFTTLTTVPHKTGALPRMYSASVTLPAAACPACTVRVRQIMLPSEPAAGAVCPPANLAAGLTYYSCANVVLTGGVTPPPADAGAADTGGGGDASNDAGGGAAGRAGSGGRAGTGGTVGTTGSGGAAAETGGATGTGGGSIGSGGLTASGGSTGTTASGGITGSGNGASSGAADASSNGGAPGVTGGSDSAGCACALTGTTAARATSASIFGLLIAFAARRGRRRRNKNT